MNSKSAEVLTSNIMNNCASFPVEIELCHLTRLLGGACMHANNQNTVTKITKRGSHGFEYFPSYCLMV